MNNMSFNKYLITAIFLVFLTSTNAFAKITLFFCAGSIYVSSHKTNVSQLNGIGKRMPWTMCAFALAALSMIGVPPASGFLTKWYLVIGSMERHSLSVLFVLLVSSFLNAVYFVPIIINAFFKKEKSTELTENETNNNSSKIKENPYLVVPLTVTAIISILLGIYPDFIVKIAKMVV